MGTMEGDIMKRATLSRKIATEGREAERKERAWSAVNHEAHDKQFFEKQIETINSQLSCSNTHCMSLECRKT